jgi:hypothetical protein
MTPVRLGIDHAVQTDENLNHVCILLDKRQPAELNVQVLTPHIIQGARFILVIKQSSAVVLEK